MIRKLAFIVPTILLIVALILPILVVFKNFLLPGHLAWGDAPFFYQEGLKELVREPLSWVGRGNSLGGVNNVLFIWPLMFLYGLIGNNDVAIRLLFYFPSVIFAGVGTYFLTRYLKLSKVTQFFAVLFYILNTYFILLIDGGQVGVALAYGIFPLVLFFLKKKVDSPTLNNFYIGLISLFILGVADPRIAAISILTLAVWQIVTQKFKSLIYLLPLVFCWIIVSLYWIYPLIKNSVGSSTSAFGGAVGTKWYNPLFLFTPHWPENLFGKMTKPPIYFAGIPLLILIGGIRQKKYFTLFAVFSLLTLGFLPFSKLPFGFAFRDSTKFFTPLVLFAGILIGSAVARFNNLFIRSFVYLYIVLLVSPALLGRMNFVLSERAHSSDLQKIYEILKTESGFYRSAWFPEKHPLAYETLNNPVVDGRDLVHFWPLANLNGSEDVFNLLNNEKYVDWLKVFGIRYLVMSGNPREISKTEKDQKDWNTITSLVGKTPGLEKVSSNTDIPVYKVSSTYPRIYSIEKIAAVIGQPLLDTYPSVYFEDGKLDHKKLEGLNKDSVVLIFNNREKSDLAMSFLQEHFVGSNEATQKEWAIYSSDQYLKYKYELLIRGVKFNDFDFGKGISFSTKRGEKIKFEFKVPATGKYVFIKRLMIPENGDTTFKWTTLEMDLEKGKHIEMVENSNDMQILNVVGLVSKKDYDEAQKLAQTFVSHFKVINVEKLSSLSDSEYQSLQIENKGILKYQFEPLKSGYWVILNENYNRLWQLKRSPDYFSSIPIYSAINGFYVDPAWRSLSIEFRGQENVRWGMYFSVVSILLLVIIYLWKKSK